MVTLAGPSAGCFTDSEPVCRIEAHEGSEVRGTLVGVESEVHAAEFPSDTHPISVTTNAVNRELRRAGDGVGFDGEKIDLSFGGVRLSFRKPTQLGATTLAALGGEVCEWRGRSDRVCEAIDGAVDVVAMAEPCTKDACAAFDIRLHMPARETPPASAFVQGEGRLLHKEWTEEACWHVSNEEDCLFDNCFLGVEL